MRDGGAEEEGEAAPEVEAARPEPVAEVRQ
jgi:hypothetical protein